MKRLTQKRYFEIFGQILTTNADIAAVLQELGGMRDTIAEGNPSGTAQWRQRRAVGRLNAAIRRLADVRSTIANLKP